MSEHAKRSIDEILTIPIHEHLQTYNIIKHFKAKNTIFNNGPYTINIPTDPHTVTTTDIQINMRHTHTSIVSRHLATRGNNKILRTPPSHISSSEEKLNYITSRTLAQPRTNKSPFLKSYLHKVDAQSHPSPLCLLCNTHTSSLQLHRHMHHSITPGFVDRLRRSDCTASQMDGEAGWWTTSGKIGFLTLARVMGVGRQQLMSKIKSIIDTKVNAYNTVLFESFVSHGFSPDTISWYADSNS